MSEENESDLSVYEDDDSENSSSPSKENSRLSGYKLIRQFELNQSRNSETGPENAQAFALKNYFEGGITGGTNSNENDNFDEEAKVVG